MTQTAKQPDLAAHCTTCGQEIPQHDYFYPTDDRKKLETARTTVNRIFRGGVKDALTISRLITNQLERRA